MHTSTNIFTTLKASVNYIALPRIDSEVFSEQKQVGEYAVHSFIYFNSSQAGWRTQQTSVQIDFLQTFWETWNFSGASI